MPANDSAPRGRALPIGRLGGGIGETRTRVARVQTGHSPFELRSRGRPGRNRTFSPSFGGSLVTMTLRPRRARFARRLVGESNPSHPMDSGAATPVASRGEIAG